MGRRWCGPSTAGGPEAGDSFRGTQAPCGLPPHHVAEVVHPEVESTESNGHDQQRGTEDYRDPGAATMGPQNHEQVGEHAVADERAHRVAAREAPGVVMEERGGIGWPRAANRELERRIE